MARKDLYQVACITGRSLGLLPPSDKKKTMKVLVGSDNGIVTCFRIKKGEVLEEFKTGNLDYPVQKLLVGGPVDKRDKIYFTSAQTIRGVNRKGKECFKFATEGAEALKGLCVDDTRIWTSGEYMFNHYLDCKDAGYYMSKDRINDLLVLPIVNLVDKNPVLGCQDRYLRVLDSNKLFMEAFVDGPILTLAPYMSKSFDDVLRGNKDKEVLYGTDNGLVGQMLITSEVAKPGWTIGNVRGLGGVSAMKSFDLTQNGQADIIVGRDDGELQVFSLDEANQPQQVFTKTVSESIQEVDIGKVCTSSFEEVVIATYSGKVISFTTETAEGHLDQSFPSAIREKVLTEGGPPGPAGAKEEEKKPEEKKMKRGLSSLFGLGKKKDKDKPEKDKFVAGLVLDHDPKADEGKGDKDEAVRSDPQEKQKKAIVFRNEIEVLRQKVAEAKSAFQGISKENVPVSTRSKVKSSMLLEPENACYKLTLESEMPIDIVALQAGIPLQLLDCGTSVPSISEPDPANGNLFIATLRVQGTSNRVQVQVMTEEGVYGTLQAFVVTRVAPKVVHLVETRILPLSLHQPIPLDAPEKGGAVPYCEVRMQGGFGMGQMHSWVQSCFPSVPSKVPDADTVKYNFESCYCATRVSVEFGRGEAVFRSSNLSVLAIIKDVISKEAATTKTKLDVKAPVINEASVLHVLQLLHPKLEKLLKLKERVKFITALTEIKAQSDDVSFLSDDLKTVLKNSEELLEEHKNNEKKIIFIEHVLQQYYIDRFKFRGINVKHRLGEVNALIEKYSWESLVQLFGAS